MAIGTPADLGGKNIAASANTNTVALTTTVAADPGDTIIVKVMSSTIGRVLSSVADSAGNTYTVDITSNDGTNDGNVYICSAPVTTQLPIGGTITATFASSLTSIRGIMAMKVSGVASAGRLDRTAVGTNTTSGWSAVDSAPTTQADELLVGAAVFASTQTGVPGTHFAGGTTYNEIFDFNGQAKTFYGEWLVVSSTGTFRAAGTWSASGARWFAAFASYKADSGGLFVPGIDIYCQGG